jgi:PTS system nitrogen regulatory IIA component
MNLAELITGQNIFLNLEGTDRHSVYREILQKGSEAGLFSHALIESTFEALLARDAVMTTGLGEGLALPHTPVETLEQLTLFLARTIHPIDCQSLDDLPANLFVMILTPGGQPHLHLEVLAILARILSDPKRRQKIDAAQTPDDVLQAVL